MACVPVGGRGSTVRVRNENPSRVQMTAEQLMREARDGWEPELRPPRRGIADPEELSEHRLRRRSEFEHLVRRAGSPSSAWIKYARWEESQRDAARVRSVLERALDATSHRDHTVWLAYAGFEMRNRRVDGARNVWDRAVAVLPRADQLWLKYAHMEETLGAVANARRVFERWTAWRPGVAAWESYARFELRYGEVGRARAVYERLVQEHPHADAFVRYAEFEARHGEASMARRVYERAVGVVDPEEDGAELLLLSFAGFEEQSGATDRARAVYRHGLDRPPEGRADELRRSFLAFERRFGHGEATVDAVTATRRAQYERAVAGDPLDYDSWAVANLPPAEEKRHWRRYIYLWITRALYEELDAQDTDKARAAYRDCLRLIPHGKFSFAKVWIMAAQLEVRQKDLTAARRILGNAIGLAPKHKIFTKYIDMEMQLGNIARCRILYEKYIQWAPTNCYAWAKYAEMEESLGEKDRARAIYQLAMNHTAGRLEEAFPEKENMTSLLNDAATGIKRKRLEDTVPQNLKILEAAYNWKKQKISQCGNFCSSLGQALQA
ncbi:hypothetical protein ACP70R_009505 [Stipagrostis hirtigluma subsp. patula]